MRKGNVLIYGKIQLQSETEPLNNLFDVLKKIVDELGYPESADKELEEQLKTELGDNGTEDKEDSNTREKIL